MTGADVKRQLTDHYRHESDCEYCAALAALDDCVVLTREDVPAVVKRLFIDVGWDTLSDEERQAWADRLWRCLTPDADEGEAGDEWTRAQEAEFEFRHGGGDG